MNQETPSTSLASDPVGVAENLLREHPDAFVCALTADGLTTPLPKSVQLFGQAVLEGRALIDHVAAADRVTVIRTWRDMIEGKERKAMVRLSSAPERWWDLYFLDTRPTHGCILGVLIPTERNADLEATVSAAEQTAPRFATLIENEKAEVVDCDEAFVRMFGYQPEELIGHNVLEQIHPDDQARAVESWLAMLATNRVQQARMRRQRKDGSWIWVDVTMHNLLHDPERRHVLVELIDVSAEMAAQEAVAEWAELSRRLMEAMPDGVMHVDRDRQVLFHNARLLEILHVHPEGARHTEPEREAETLTGTGRCLGLLLRTLSEPGNLRFHFALGQAIEGGHQEEIDCDFQTREGQWRKAHFTLRPLQREGRAVSGVLVTVLDITDEVQARQELERRATYDPLTHTLNRSSILSTVERELEGPGREETAVIYVDLDHFKEINDTLGHAAGDEVLVAVVGRMRRAIRGQDRIGRLGGDEFLILIRGLPEPQVALGVAERISRSLEEPLALAGGLRLVRASLGVAWPGGRELKVEELVEEADRAMYASKEARAGKPVLAQPLH